MLILKKLIGNISLVLIVATCLTSCTKKESHSSQTLHINLGSDVATLDPRIASDDASSVVIMMLYDGLVRVNSDHIPQLSLAEHLEISDNQKKFTFFLKKTTFANGKPLKAQDFISTLQACINPQHPSNNISEYYIIKNAKEISLGKLPIEQLGVKAIDDYTLCFELVHPCPYFLYLLSNWIFYPLPSDVDQLNPDFMYALDHLKVNNGPFNLKSWKHHERIILEKNPNYWDKDNVHLDSIVIEMIEDQNNELELFKQGKLDFAGSPVSNGLPLQSLDTLNKERKLQFADYSKVYWYVFNLEKSLLKNLNLRKALTYCIDREQIVRHITKYGAAMALSPFPPGYAQKAVHFENAQIDVAKKHFEIALKELGLTADALNLTLSIYGVSSGRKIAEAICYQWKKHLGIHVAIELNEWSSFIDKLFHKNYDMAALNWIPFYYDPMAFLASFDDPQNPSNLSGWYNPIFTQNLQNAKKATNAVLRKRYLLEAENILTDELPVLPLFYNAPVYIKNEKLEGIVITKTGQIDFKWAYFK